MAIKVDVLQQICHAYVLIEDFLWGISKESHLKEDNENAFGSTIKRIFIDITQFYITEHLNKNRNIQKILYSY